MFPDAMQPLHCWTGGGDPTLACYLTIMLMITTALLYLVIGIRFLSVFSDRSVALCLTGIFWLCLACGYIPSPAAQFVDANIAYTGRLVILLIQQPICIWFIGETFRKRFRTYDRHASYGRMLEGQAIDHEIETDDLIRIAIETAKRLRDE